VRLVVRILGVGFASMEVGGLGRLLGLSGGLAEELAGELIEEMW
jgi:hypothetical protein